MTIEGSWKGAFQQIWPSAKDPLPLSFELRQTILGSVRGAVRFMGTTAEEPSAPIKGRHFFRSLSISRDMHTYLPARPAPTQAEPTDPNASASSHPAPDWPTEFNGRILSAGELSGTWRTMTTWMVGNRRRKVPVVLAHGTWTARRIAQPDSGAA